MHGCPTPGTNNNVITANISEDPDDEALDVGEVDPGRLVTHQQEAEVGGQQQRGGTRGAAGNSRGGCGGGAKKRAGRKQ